MLRSILVIVLAVQPVLAAAPVQVVPNATAPKAQPASEPQVEQPQPEPKPAPLTPADAVAMAMADIATLPTEIASQRRYLWCLNASKEEHAAVAYTLNSTWSHSVVDVYPKVLGKGELVAIDLRLCAPDDKTEYDRLRLLWEKLAVKEPYFHVPGKYKQTVAPYKDKAGKEINFRWVDGFVEAPYLGQGIYDLEQATGSYAPILRADYWMVRSLDAANGGIYYEIRGLEAGKTKLEDYLVSRGASKEQAQRLRADEKAVFVSEVTDKPRAVTMFPTSSTRLTTGLGVAAITDDIFDETDDAEFDPMRNFLESKTDGHEVFVTTPSGWLEFTLFNGKGELVREAPPNLVADRRIPEPHTPRLQGGISCIRCHGPKEMWQPFTNEVSAMLSKQLNVYGELNTKSSQYDVLQRLAGLYSGDLSEILVQARNGAAKRTFAVMKMQPAEAAAALSNTYNDYVFKRVGAKTACFELGIVVPEDDTLGVQTFKNSVPPLERVFDDPVIGRLQVEFLDIDRKANRGLTLTRRQFELVYADAMSRVIAARSQKGDQK